MNFQTRALIFIGIAMACRAAMAQPDYPFQPVTFTQVQLKDQFWMPRIRANHEVTIPASFARCEQTGRVKNFEMAAQRIGKFCTVFPFDDTDIYKTIEGASFSIMLFPDPKLVRYMDSLIRIVASAQEADGYLYTARTIDPVHPHAWSGANRWEKERELSHELYNSGHLFEAAAAHFHATGKKNLLDIALKNADLICAVFGNGKRRVAPGHEVVEMGLVKLYRITGKKEYLETAAFFVDERGRFDGYTKGDPDVFRSGAYWQDHIPVTEQREAIGHAVRAGYLYAAVADIAALKGDTALLHAIDSIWLNVVSKKLYVQGGAGAIPSGEQYGANYELPNATAYNETCAAIANVYWNQRMFQLHGDSKYIDVLEKILYNGLISGVGLDGKTFFYTNAMQVRNSFSHAGLESERAGWFECSCCPTNMARFLPSLPGYMYAQQGNSVYINLFASSEAELKVGGKKLGIKQRNNYPWDGNLQFDITVDKSMPALSFRLRVPGWSTNSAIPSDLYHFRDSLENKLVLMVNGKPQSIHIVNGYAVIDRVWKSGDNITLQLPMDTRRVLAHEKLGENRGKVALQKGPLVYCVEWADNEGKAANIILPAHTSIQVKSRPDLLNGVQVLQAEGLAVLVGPEEVRTVKQTVTAIPYFAWANRGRGEMTVWIPEKISEVDIVSALPGDKQIKK